MTVPYRTAAAALALAALLSGRSAASAATARTLTLNTEVTDSILHASPGAYDGILRLSIAPSGIVSGSYRWEDAGVFQPVTGGVDPKGNIWLDIGEGMGARVTGTLRDGVIDGTLSGPNPRDLFAFHAHVAPSGTPQ